MTTSSLQWSYLLQHLGVWDGSFTRLGPDGAIAEDSPTRVTLEGQDENRAIRQTIQHFSAETGEELQHKVLEYRSLNRSTLFFENGAFSQGSLQYGPFSEFGAEMGFIEGDRRMRLVSLYGTDGNRSRLTLIREHRQGRDRQEHPPLTVDQLLGDWQGQSTTLYADLRNPSQAETRLSLWREGDRLHQRLITTGLDFQSTAIIRGSSLSFESGAFPNQVVLLPDGASCTGPLAIPKGHPFFLEAGWLTGSDRRQRLLRYYDDRGTWVSLTLVVERRVG